MGIFDKFKGKAEDLKDKASDLVDGHGDKVGEGLDKAGDFVDEKTGGKYGDKIDRRRRQGQGRVGQPGRPERRHPRRTQARLTYPEGPQAPACGPSPCPARPPRRGGRETWDRRR